ncbi:MAG: arginine deiminase family protein [Bacteroidales bacterium]
MAESRVRSEINIRSEIGRLEAVILHTPGAEVENMTPENAERALYSDILNLSVVQQEYSQLEKVLDKVARTYQVRALLKDILENEKVKHNIISAICENENLNGVRSQLMELDAANLATQLIEGVVMEKDTLTKFWSQQRYSLMPLHNFFFTRDAAVAIRDKVLISRMANRVRERESIIMEAIFDYHPDFITTTVNPYREKVLPKETRIEGGDVLVARDDVFLIGIGSRTSPQGVDLLLERIKKIGERRYVIVQELPHKPESFIHLDMVFTFLNTHECMVYEPVILKPNRLQTVMITIDNGRVAGIQEQDNLLTALTSLGFDLEPLFCGGSRDEWIQEREQWHSGANFFAFAPGKVIGYARNVYTMEELSNHGYAIIPAADVISGKTDPDSVEKCAVTLDGSELPRGGGGARCMTMPIIRQPVSW